MRVLETHGAPTITIVRAIPAFVRSAPAIPRPSSATVKLIVKGLAARGVRGLNIVLAWPEAVLRAVLLSIGIAERKASVPVLDLNGAEIIVRAIALHVMPAITGIVIQKTIVRV